jgi:flagellar biosynthetic protein FliR
MPIEFMPNLENIFATVLPVAARISGMVLFAPFLGSASVPARIKAGLVVLFTVLLYPVCAAHSALPVRPAGWARICASEMFVGLLLGLAVAFVFEGAQLAGQVLGFQAGFSLVNVMDPQTMVDTPVLAMFHQTVAILIFLQLDVHHWVLRGVAKSFHYLPVGAAVATPALTRDLLHAAGGIWVAGVQIAGPTLVATMLADVAIGFLGKASPQFPLLFLEIPAKNLLALGLTAGTLAYWPALFERHFSAAVSTSERLLRLTS